MRDEEEPQENILFQIHVALGRKYDLYFNRFRGIQIKKICMSAKRSKSTLRCKDVAIWSDSQQWMLKVYGRINNDQSEEILDRISLLTSHFANSKNQMGSEYPTMFVTQTERIFLTRFRRKQKYVLLNYSSENENDSQKSSEFSKFLKVFHSYQSKQASSNSQWTFLSINNSFTCKSKQYTLFNIYQGSQNMSQSEESSSVQTSECETLNFKGNVEHLIYDFEEINQQQLLQTIKNSSQKFKEKVKVQLFKGQNRYMKSFLFDEAEQIMYEQTYDDQIAVTPKMHEHSKKRYNFLNTKRQEESTREKASKLLTRIQNSSQYFHKSTFLSSFK